MDKLIATVPLIYEPDYYVRGIITKDLIENGVDPTEDQLETVRRNVNGFLRDCLRVGLYHLYNFYGRFHLSSSCSTRLYRVWNYNFYLQERYMTFFLNEDLTIRVTRSDEEVPQPEMRVCRLLQKPPYLPHQEVIDACGLIPDPERPGLRPWHNSDSNYFLAVAYGLSESVNPVIPVKEMKDYIIASHNPFLIPYL